MNALQQTILQQLKEYTKQNVWWRCVFRFSTWRNNQVSLVNTIRKQIKNNDQFNVAEVIGRLLMLDNVSTAVVSRKPRFWNRFLTKKPKQQLRIPLKRKFNAAGRQLINNLWTALTEAADHDFLQSFHYHGAVHNEICDKKLLGLSYAARSELTKEQLQKIINKYRDAPNGSAMLARALNHHALGMEYTYHVANVARDIHQDYFCPDLGEAILDCVEEIEDPWIRLEIISAALFKIRSYAENNRFVRSRQAVIEKINACHTRALIEIDNFPYPEQWIDNLQGLLQLAKMQINPLNYVNAITILSRFDEAPLALQCKVLTDPDPALNPIRDALLTTSAPRGVCLSEEDEPEDLPQCHFDVVDLLARRKEGSCLFQALIASIRTSRHKFVERSIVELFQSLTLDRQMALIGQVLAFPALPASSSQDLDTEGVNLRLRCIHFLYQMSNRHTNNPVSYFFEHHFKPLQQFSQQDWHDLILSPIHLDHFLQLPPRFRDMPEIFIKNLTRVYNNPQLNRSFDLTTVNRLCHIKTKVGTNWFSYALMNDWLTPDGINAVLADFKKLSAEDQWLLYTTQNKNRISIATLAHKKNLNAITTHFESAIKINLRPARPLRAWNLHPEQKHFCGRVSAINRHNCAPVITQSPAFKSP